MVRVGIDLNADESAVRSAVLPRERPAERDALIDRIVIQQLEERPLILLLDERLAVIAQRRRIASCMALYNIAKVHRADDIPKAVSPPVEDINAHVFRRDQLQKMLRIAFFLPRSREYALQFFCIISLVFHTAAP